MQQANTRNTSRQLAAAICVEEFDSRDWLREEFDGVSVETLVGDGPLSISAGALGAEVFADLALAA